MFIYLLKKYFLSLLCVRCSGKHCDNDVEQNQLSNLLLRNLQVWGLEIYLTNNPNKKYIITDKCSEGN